MPQGDRVVAGDLPDDGLRDSGHRDAEQAADDAAEDDQPWAAEPHSGAEDHGHGRHPQQRLAGEEDVLPLREPGQQHVDDEDAEEGDGDRSAEAQVVGGEAVDRLDGGHDPGEIERRLELRAEVGQRRDEHGGARGEDHEPQQRLERPRQHGAGVLALQDQAEHRDECDDDPRLREDVGDDPVEHAHVRPPGSRAWGSASP